MSCDGKPPKEPLAFCLAPVFEAKIYFSEGKPSCGKPSEKIWQEKNRHVDTKDPSDLLKNESLK